MKKSELTVGQEYEINKYGKRGVYLGTFNGVKSSIYSSRVDTSTDAEKGRDPKGAMHGVFEVDDTRSAGTRREVVAFTNVQPLGSYEARVAAQQEKAARRAKVEVARRNYEEELRQSVRDAGVEIADYQVRRDHRGFNDVVINADVLEALIAKAAQA